jgi:hypothetical protein
LEYSPMFAPKDSPFCFTKLWKRKRRFVDNRWKWVLGAFENHGYVCFRTSLADPVIWRHFQ